MNGKMAKMLRSISRDSHADKRQLKALDHKSRGLMRKDVAEWVAIQKLIALNAAAAEAEVILDIETVSA